MLFQRLELLANSEGVSLNQYLLYSLTQHASRAYRVYPVPQAEIERQHRAYDALIEALGTAADAEFDMIPEEGELAEPEIAVDPELAAQVEVQIAAARHAVSSGG